MRIAYLDCFSGISGDMFLGALLSAGVPEQLLHDTVKALNAAGNLDARLEVHRTERSGISATKVDVWVGDEKDSPRDGHSQAAASHRHQHSHGHAHDAKSMPAKTAPTNVGPGAVREHRHASHRGLREIAEIIAKAEIAPSAKRKALSIFQALGAAEAKIHNKPIEEVHFHEVGAGDAIVDIVCAAVGSEALAVEEWVCSPLNLGSGSVECAHGRFPVPAPAAAELLRAAPVYSSGIEAELVTPTGAAIVNQLASRFAPLPKMKVDAIGYGAGSRDFPGHANVVRLLVGTAEEETLIAAGDDLESVVSRETVAVLEASLDDLNPQVFGYVLDRLLAEGALDAFSTPLHMKKNRPGALLTVLARPDEASRLAKLIFSETSTLGVRIRKESRVTLLRRYTRVQTPWGEVQIKIASMNGSVAHYAPEYEDCRRIASQNHIPLKQVMQEAVRAYLAGEGKTRERSAGENS